MALTRSQIVVACLLVGSIIGTSFFLKKRQQRSRISLPLLIDKLENRIQQDEGNRGIKDFLLHGELYNASQALFRAQKVCILTGFPCLLDHNPPTETDGPPGALAIARACIALGKDVHILTDEVNEEVILSCVSKSKISGGRLSLSSFPALSEWNDDDEERLREIADDTECIIAIERPGRSKDGHYYTMKGRDMTPLVAPIEQILSIRPFTPSIGIGDGGNEVGMGKVRKLILNSTSLANGSKIGALSATDHLIVCSVSNWGGYALSAALAAIAIYDNNFRNNSNMIDSILGSEDEIVDAVQRCVDAGARDGMTQELKLYVDGMPISESVKVFQDLKSILLSN